MGETESSTLIVEALKGVTEGQKQLVESDNEVKGTVKELSVKIDKLHTHGPLHCDAGEKMDGRVRDLELGNAAAPQPGEAQRKTSEISVKAAGMSATARGEIAERIAAWVCRAVGFALFVALVLFVVWSHENPNTPIKEAIQKVGKNGTGTEDGRLADAGEPESR